MLLPSGPALTGLRSQRVRGPRAVPWGPEVRATAVDGIPRRRKRPGVRPSGPNVWSWSPATMPAGVVSVVTPAFPSSSVPTTGAFGTPGSPGPSPRRSGRWRAGAGGRPAGRPVSPKPQRRRGGGWSRRIPFAVVPLRGVLALPPRSAAVGVAVRSRLAPVAEALGLRAFMSRASRSGLWRRRPRQKGRRRRRSPRAVAVEAPDPDRSRYR